MNIEIKMIDKTKRWLWNIISSGLPVDYDLEKPRKIFLLNIIIIIGSAFLVLLGTIAYIRQDYILGTVDYSVYLFAMWLFFFLRRTKNHNFVAMIGTIVIGIFNFFLIAYGGISKTIYEWSYTYPLISLFLLGNRLGTFMSLLLLVMACTVFAFGSKVSFFTSYSIDHIIRFITVYVTIYLFAFVMEKVREIVQYRLITSNFELEKAVRELEKANEEKDRLIHELQKTMYEVKTLQGIIPICSNCKKIRDDSGYWEQVEKYVKDRSDAEFSHSICPECAKMLYPDLDIWDRT